MRTICLALALIQALALANEAAKKPPTELERAVDEFKTQTEAAGLRGGGSFSRDAQAPKRVWHGRLFENLRNDLLDAIPHEVRQRGGEKSLLRRNQFGFNVAGPVFVPRVMSGKNTFFSLSYEGVRERVARSFLRTVPTLGERAGDDTAVVDPSGNVLPLFDPATTRQNPAYNSALPVSAGNLQYLRDRFPGNRIPAGRLDPTALAAIALYPKPNVSVGPFQQNNYFVQSPETNVADGFLGKVDHTWGESQRITSEFNLSSGLLGAPKLFSTSANPGAPDRNFSTRRASFQHVYTASPQTVNTASIEVVSSVSRGGDSNQTPVPVYQFDPYLGMGTSFPLSKDARNTYTFSDELTLRVGKKSLRVSGQFVAYQVNTLSEKYPSAYFHFSSGLTSLPGVNDTGGAFASYLLGMPDYAERSFTVAPSYFRQSYSSMNLHDKYELLPGLTLSAGLNLSLHTPRVEKYNRQSTIDLTAIDPSSGLPGALVAASEGHPAFRPRIVRLDPSVSIAWSPLKNTVVRTDFWRAYSPIPIYSGQWGTQGFNGRSTIVSPNVELMPAALLSQGLPALPNTLPDLRPGSANNTVADLVDPTSREPLFQAASLSVEQQLPLSLVLSVGATYSGGRNLLVGNDSANPNAISPHALRYANQLYNEAFASSLRPYPQYKGFDLYGQYPIGRYQRDAGFLRLEKRASNGFSLRAYYEISKQLDDYSGPYGAQDLFNRRNDWALTAYNVPQHLQIGYVYELPFGTNTPFLNLTGWPRPLVDGWSVSGSAYLAEGTPLALHPEFNNTGNIIPALNVDVVPGVDPSVANPGPSLWFNPAAFAQPADFTLGNASRTSSTLRNPGTQSFDLSVNKRLELSINRAMEFTASAFDFLNHADWNDPDTTIGPASAPNLNAGKITGSHGGRVIQVGVAYSF